ncbi:MAG: hypothetical protein PT977_07995 [Acidobacteriota bacterium]|nr:hypothetical protein [Acidobacteriota bacterium]
MRERIQKASETLGEIGLVRETCGTVQRSKVPQSGHDENGRREVSPVDAAESSFFVASRFESREPALKPIGRRPQRPLQVCGETSREYTERIPMLSVRSLVLEDSGEFGWI